MEPIRLKSALNTDMDFEQACEKAIAYFKRQLGIQNGFNNCWKHNAGVFATTLYTGRAKLPILDQLQGSQYTSEGHIADSRAFVSIKPVLSTEYHLQGDDHFVNITAVKSIDFIVQPHYNSGIQLVEQGRIAICEKKLREVFDPEFASDLAARIGNEKGVLLFIDIIIWLLNKVAKQEGFSEILETFVQTAHTKNLMLLGIRVRMSDYKINFLKQTIALVLRKITAEA